MEQKLITALRAHYIAKKEIAEANLLNYFKNPSGIGEHPDIVGEMANLVDKIGQARDGLSVIDSLVQTTSDDSEPAVD